MKKLKLVLLVAILMFAVVGCSSSKAISAKDVLENTIKVSKEIESQHAKLEQQQSTKIGKEEASSTTIIEMDVNTKQQAIYQVMSNDSSDLKISMYVSKEGIYMSQNGLDWGVVKEFNLDEIFTQAQELTESVLEAILEYADEIKLTEKNNQYVLDFDGSNDKFKDIFKSQLSKTMPEGVNLDKVLESTKLNEFKYQYIVDKKTGYLMKSVVDMDIELNVEGNTLGFVNKTSTEFSKHNEVGEIVVPQEIKDSAVEQ